MPAGIYLALAIASEVGASVLLRLSDGFTRALPVVTSLVGYGLSLFMLSRALRGIPLGTCYAIWAAIGTVAVAGLGVSLFGESLNGLQLASIGVIVVGVVGLQLGG
jgi:multidrug transporter EmrE-like cation transporter